MIGQHKALSESIGKVVCKFLAIELCVGRVDNSMVVGTQHYNVLTYVGAAMAEILDVVTLGDRMAVSRLKVMSTYLAPVTIVGLQRICERGISTVSSLFNQELREFTAVLKPGHVRSRLLSHRASTVCTNNRDAIVIADCLEYSPPVELVGYATGWNDLQFRTRRFRERPLNEWLNPQFIGWIYSPSIVLARIRPRQTQAFKAEWNRWHGHETVNDPSPCSTFVRPVMTTDRSINIRLDPVKNEREIYPAAELFGLNRVLLDELQEEQLTRLQRRVRWSHIQCEHRRANAFVNLSEAYVKPTHLLPLRAKRIVQPGRVVSQVVDAQ